MRADQYKIMYEVEEEHFWYKGMRRIIDAMIENLIPKKRNLKILDAGCGTGSNMIHFRKLGKVYGIDISFEAIAYCKKRGLKNLKVASINNIPYETHTFDLIICFDVLGQEEVKNYEKALKEIYRVLKPGGMLILRTAAYQWLFSKHDRIVHTKQRFTSEKLKKILQDNKFRILKLTYANTLLFPLALIKRTMDRNRDSSSDSSDVKMLNPLLNFLLLIPLYFESFILKYLKLPFGLSLISIVKK